jgi:uncharacterized phage protein gp47/JayE
MVYGLTNTGFIKKRQPDIQDELEEKFRAAFGNEINLLPTSIFGQVIGIFSEREASLWDLLEEIYNSAFPDTATGVSLDNACALTGVTRLEATYSTVTARVFGTLLTLIPAGSIFSVDGIPDNRFISLDNGEIHAGINEIQRLTFSAVPASGTWAITYDGQTTGPIAHNASNATIQSALNGLSNLSGVVVTGNYSSYIQIEFAGSDGEKDHIMVTTTNTLQDGLTNPITITATEYQKGFLPHVDVLCRAEVTGAITAPANTLTVIETPLFGMDSVTNLLDAAVGNERETDSELRLRRIESLRAIGTSTINGIVNSLRDLDGITSCFVFENNGDVTDGDGRPPHSYEAFIQGGDNDEIFQTLWLTKPAGIATYGNISGLVLDSQGFEHTLYFSRPVEKLIYLVIEITKNTDPLEIGGVYPANGDTLVRDAVLAYGATFQIGQDVVLPRFWTPINTIPGILGIVVKAGFTAGPTGTSNLAIGAKELALFDTTRTTVTS